MSSEPRTGSEATGLAHVATVSFLASRAAPSIGFWVALTGGAALARSGERDGLRWGYGASLAAMLQTVAIMGPARIAVPLTQAASAPLLGHMGGRGASLLRQVVACGAIRLVHNAITAAFFILVLSGGLSTYTGTYDSLAGHLPLLPEGSTAALVATAVAIVAWTVFASIVQVHAYRRARRRWRAVDEPAKSAAPPAADRDRRYRYDPRAVALAAAITFALLIASTAWPLLAAVAAFLALASITARGDTSVAAAGLGLAALLALVVFAFTLVSGIDIEHAAQRGVRAGLLVAAATWLRVAAGTGGLREVSRRTLGRLRRLPSMAEAASVLDRLDSGRQMRSAAGSALTALGEANMRPLPLLDASVAWASSESATFEPLSPAEPAQLRARLRDAALVALAVAPGLTLLV